MEKVEQTEGAVVEKKVPLKELNAAAIEKMTGEFREVIAGVELKDGEYKANGRDVFEGNLPEHITPKIVSDLANHVTNTAVAAHTAMGEHAIEAMAKDKGLEKVIGRMDFGPIGDASSYVNRVGTSRNPQTKEEVEVIGQNRLSLNIFTPGGQRLTAARDAVKALAAEKLKV